MWFQEVEAGYVKWVNVGKPVQCQWKAIALPSSSWYRKAYGVVVHWRCWLVQAIPRHQAQVFFKITLHACHDCTDATSKFQPFHTFQRSTKTHRQFLLVFAACSAASGTSLWASRPQEQSGHPQWLLTSPHDPRSSLVIGSEIDVSSILFRELVLPLVPPDGHCDLQLWTSLPELWVSRKGEKKPHVQILQFCSVRRIELQAETQQMGHLTEHRERTNLTAQCQHALWTFTWQGRTPIRLSRASSHDVTMTTCIRAIASRSFPREIPVRGRFFSNAVFNHFPLEDFSQTNGDRLVGAPRAHFRQKLKIDT